MLYIIVAIYKQSIHESYVIVSKVVSEKNEIKFFKKTISEFF